jgi:hypothetical protein
VPQRGSEIIDIVGEIQAETDKAYRFFDGLRVVWLPKSQCEWDVDEKTMTMPMWLAKDKEII